MTVWRPPNSIRVKAIGLAWHAQRLLVADVETDSGMVKGVRPLGGSIDYGETREQALHREFQEELATGIRIVGPWHVFENIYRHEGQLGHEIVFAADVELVDTSLHARTEILFSENDGTPARARWVNPAELSAAGLQLFPDGLGAWLASRSSSARA
jgi:8-oxo-dGTP pyrophosphatase MutT (NUDIX family)